MHRPSAILLSLFHFALSTTVEPPAVKFWLSVELQSITWKLGCLNTGGCAEPRLRLLKSNLVNGEKLSIDWPVTGDIVKEKSRPFVSHWSIDSPDDVMLTCEVIGVDPMYGFPRVCDSSASVRVYAPFPPIAKSDTAKKIRRDLDRNAIATFDSSSAQLLIKLDGKCFNATLIGRKYAERCPWCKEETPDVAIGGPNPTDASADFMRQLSTGDQILQISVVGLAVITVITSAGCALLLVACLRQKAKISRQTQKFPNRQTFEYHEQPRELGGTVTSQRGSAGEDSLCKYDVPWDTKFRPLPHFPTSDYTEADADSLPGRSSGSTATPFGRSIRISPNASSIHDDSGMDSV